MKRIELNKITKIEDPYLVEILSTLHKNGIQYRGSREVVWPSEKVTCLYFFESDAHYYTEYQPLIGKLWFDTLAKYEKEYDQIHVEVAATNHQIVVSVTEFNEHDVVKGIENIPRGLGPRIRGDTIKPEKTRKRKRARI